MFGPEAGTPDPGGEDAGAGHLPRLQPSPSSPRTAAATRSSSTRVADLVAEWCLVGWDTGGVPWDEAS